MAIPCSLTECHNQAALVVHRPLSYARFVTPPPPAALYLHVPFCPSICPYCDFHKMKRHNGLVAAYLQRLDRESAELRGKYGGAMKTTYLGGGIFSMLEDDEL